MSQDEDAPAPDVVDFDALHAALGELPPAPTSSSPTVGESQGRSSATYSSARPHTIPPTRAPALEGLNQPAVIVQTDDTVPTGPPQKMTIPMGKGAAFHGPSSSGPHPAAQMRSPSPAHPMSPQPFVADAVRPPMPENVNAKLTVQMPARPRRPRTPTIVVRTRGPTKQQKLVVFVAMLLVFVGGGIAFLVYGKHIGLDLGVHAPTAPARTTGMTIATAVPPPAPSPTIPAAAPTPVVAATVITSVAPSAAAPQPSVPQPSGKKSTRAR
ncbi:MAG: hypothetical protein J0I07_31585 [Myxococcales bacterium]|nr:hypothetical protein [Myxococcales bacterium]